MTPDEIAAGAIERGAVQKREELAQLVALVAIGLPAIAVEIGVYRGGTLWAWSQIAAAAIGIDDGRGLGPGETLQPYGVIRADSHDPATVVQLRHWVRYSLTYEGVRRQVDPDRPIDFLFIDGDHTYEGVARDYELYSPLVRPGGLIAFHDICHHADPQMGVERFWKGLTSRPYQAWWEFVNEPTWWGGIGVIVKP